MPPVVSPLTSGASDYRKYSYSIILTHHSSAGTGIVPGSGIEYLGMNQGFVSLARGLCGAVVAVFLDTYC